MSRIFYITWKPCAWMALGAMFFTLFIALNVALWAGEYIDSICVEGRISEAQATVMNELPWDKCPKYRQNQTGRGPDGACEAKKSHRIVIRECSEFMRGLGLRDAPWWKPIRDDFQVAVFGRRI